MIKWLTDIIGNVPIEFEFILYLGAITLVLFVVVNVINLLFNPFRFFK